MLLNGDVRHRRGGRRAVPVFLTRREPHYVARPNFLDGSSPAPHSAAAGRHDQNLT